MVTRSRVLCVLVAAALLAGCGQAAPPSSAPGGGRSGEVFTLTSEAFTDGGRIPEEYVGERAGGKNRSLPFAWSRPPAGTQAYLLAIVDHAPVANMFVHWVVTGIPSDVTSIAAGASGTSAMPAGARELENTAGTAGYRGPSPPPGSGDHDYVVTLYALSSAEVTLPGQPTAADIDRAVSGKVIDTAEITGIYSR